MCDDNTHCQDFHFHDITLFGAVCLTRFSSRERLQKLFTDVNFSQNGEPGEMECTGLEGVRGMGIPCTNGTLPDKAEKYKISA